jgi:hypothetical protein
VSERMKFRDTLQQRWTARQLARQVEQPPPPVKPVLFQDYRYTPDGSVLYREQPIGALDEWHLTYQVEQVGAAAQVARGLVTGLAYDFAVTFRARCGSHSRIWTRSYNEKPLAAVLQAAEEAGGIDYKQELARQAQERSRHRAATIEAARQAASRKRQS